MKNLTADELRDKYLKFFESKGHTIIPGASVIPENVCFFIKIGYCYNT